jgi:hypothetical protein
MHGQVEQLQIQLWRVWWTFERFLAEDCIPKTLHKTADLAHHRALKRRPLELDCHPIIPPLMLHFLHEKLTGGKLMGCAYLTPFLENVSRQVSPALACCRFQPTLG